MREKKLKRRESLGRRGRQERQKEGGWGYRIQLLSRRKIEIKATKAVHKVRVILWKIQVSRRHC